MDYFLRLTETIGILSLELELVSLIRSKFLIATGSIISKLLSPIVEYAAHYQSTEKSLLSSQCNICLRVMMDLKPFVMVLFVGTVIGQVNTDNIKGLVLIISL